MRRRSLLVCLGVLVACLAILPGCKKKKTDEGGGDGGGGGAGAPPAVSSEYVVFARLDAKSIRDSALFAEVKQAITKADGTAVWDKVEGEASKEMGFKPTDLDTVTVCVTEVPNEGEPKFVLIVASSKPIDKATAFGLGADAKPDARGFYTKRGDGLIHFPNAKTVVLLHPELAQK